MTQARAYTNIALIKYWGKSDITWNLPTSSSIGLTLDQLYTDTRVDLTDDLKQDLFILDGQLASNPRISKVLDFVRQQTGSHKYAKITSENHVPNSAGLASSASAFAAFALAASDSYGLPTDRPSLSRLARLGSGSASRSVYGGFSIWYQGYDHQSSFAQSILDPVDFGIRVIDVLTDKKTKKIPSSQGMQRAQSSLDYSNWLSQSKMQIREMIAAIKNKDIEKIGLIAERNAMGMHALNRSADKPFDYFAGETWAVINDIHRLYHAGIPAFATIDAGPNVKVITDSRSCQKVADQLKNFGEILIQKPGPGVVHV
ncbi:MAG: diphosphomevalonate decarboxylase [Oenococcus sp.]|uniref:diphosphomevalonate decarboxylase n=1 Tax=Oenococcus TaxID=46254 RepID=UPI0021E77929|nr:diphosphomevalonate decarboxylase [Oenococcus kitaharae]MCV3295884.1 diphosphomevalonate decarboxylase [Oenococcus kitaharae]